MGPHSTNGMLALTCSAVQVCTYSAYAATSHTAACSVYNYHSCPLSTRTRYQTSRADTFTDCQWTESLHRLWLQFLHIKGGGVLHDNGWGGLERGIKRFLLQLWFLWWKVKGRLWMRLTPGSLMENWACHAATLVPGVCCQGGGNQGPAKGW